MWLLTLVTRVSRGSPCWTCPKKSSLRFSIFSNLLISWLLDALVDPTQNMRTTNSCGMFQNFSLAKHLRLCAGVASGFFWARRCLDSRFPRSQALSSWAFSSRYESDSALFFFFREFSNLKILFSEKDCCRRIWTILSAEGGLYPKCIHCRLLFKFYVK